MSLFSKHDHFPYITLVLQQARGTRPAKPMATGMNALFLAKLITTRRAPLINTATNLFAEHWTGAAGNKLLVPAHDLLELVTRVFQEFQVNMRRTNASTTHTAKLQAHEATLEELLSNPTKEQPV